MWNKESKRSQMFMPVLLSACAIPLSMTFWIVNVIYSSLQPDARDRSDDHVTVSPWRWLAAVVVPLLFAFYAVKKQSLDVPGAILGNEIIPQLYNVRKYEPAPFSTVFGHSLVAYHSFFIGFILTLTSYAHLACLIAFFVSSSKATKFRYEKKKKMEGIIDGVPHRNFIQVLCNGGMSFQLALLYLLDVGCGEWPIDFDKYYRSSWLSVGILGAFACCNGDTWASEIGSVVGNSDPFLITTRERVPKGTNGGVSAIGLLVSALGGLFVGLFHYVAVLYSVDTAMLQLAVPQWPIIIIGGIGGLLGSILDSILGATLQYSGINENGVIVAHPGKGVKHISGRQILDNHSVNLLSSMAVALTLPRIANMIWP